MAVSTAFLLLVYRCLGFVATLAFRGNSGISWQLWHFAKAAIYRDNDLLYAVVDCNVVFPEAMRSWSAVEIERQSDEIARSDIRQGVSTTLSRALETGAPSESQGDWIHAKSQSIATLRARRPVAIRTVYCRAVVPESDRRSSSKGRCR